MNGCLHAKCPFSYLGIPLGEKMNRNSAWKPVLVKIKNKLSSWKAKTLLRVGRLPLIKSVFNTLPIYYMSMFKMPKSIAKKIMKLQRRFFWGDSLGHRISIPAIKWSSNELPKELGGLRVGNIKHKNLILLFNWWWRFSVADCSLWKRILLSI